MNALLVLTSIILFLAMINLQLWHRRKLKTLTAQNVQPESKRLTSDLAALNAGSIGLGERLLRIERNQKLMAQRLEQLELHANGANASYSQAINLVKQGINKQDLMATCELSEGEAGLLMVMHKNKKQRKKQVRH